ncbi:MAG TPA: urease accessory UreF family protein [Steroidobacteraceae bacterium]|jgi:urease accessory protein
MSTPQQLLRLLHLASPALPIGGFHFSQALEYAVEAGWVRDEATTLPWIAGLAQNAFGTLDLPVLARLHDGWSGENLESVRRWDALLTAARETAELRAEDRHMGGALLRILIDLQIAPAATATLTQGYAAAFAYACVHYRIAKADALAAFAWAWAENQVLAAVKLVPLGQSAGQRILDALIPCLNRIADLALTLDDDQIGVCAVLQGMASARHETQYTRLFRS